MNRPLTKGELQMFASIFKMQQPRDFGDAESRNQTRLSPEKGSDPAPLCRRAPHEGGPGCRSLPFPRALDEQFHPLLRLHPERSPHPQEGGDPPPFSRGRTGLPIAGPAGQELGYAPGAPRPPGGGAAQGTRQPRASSGTTKAPFFTRR